MGQEGFLFRAKRKWGTTLGKSRGFCFLETVYFFGSLSLFLFYLALFHFSCIFKHGAQGEKQQTSQPTTGKTARVQGGMEFGTSNQGIFSFSLGRGSVLGFGRDGL